MNSANWRRLCPASFARRLRPPPLGGRRQLVFSGDSVAGQLFAGFACELAPAERAAVAWQPFNIFHAPLAPRLITARPAGSVFVILAGTWFRVEQMDAYEAAIAQMLRTLRAHPTHNFLVLSIAAQHWRGGKYSDAARDECLQRAHALPCGDERSAEAIAEYERRLERQLRATALSATPRVNSTPFERRRDNIALFSMYNATRAWHQLHPGWKKNHNGVECDCTLLRAQGLPPTGAGAAPRGTRARRTKAARRRALVMKVLSRRL